MLKLFLLFLILLKPCFSNEVVAIKTYDRDNYIRVMFETTEKPKYFVEEKQKNKIYVNLPNTLMKSDLHKNVSKLNVINNIVSLNENNNIKFVISTKNNASLMRYLYTEPSNINKYYRVIVDIYKNNNSIEELVSKLDLVKDKNKLSSIDDLINFSIVESNKNNNINNKISTKKNSIDDLIKENVKANNINELLVLNNIINEEEVTKSFEEQNNEQINMDDFIKSISINLDDKIINKDAKKIKKDFIKNTQYIVVIDAGHGGKDPGAIGFLRTKEKNINLLYAKSIKSELEKNPKIKVVLTRSSDIFVELKDRVNKARMLNADLFISIHSDSNLNRRAKGLSVYTLMKSASDTRSVKLMTNNSKYNVINNINYWKNKIKYDNLRYKNLAESTKFTNILVRDFRDNNVKMFGSDPHKYGNFAVLLAPEFPSVLIELGFLSNFEDERMLKSSSYRKKISKSIATSVNYYFRI